MTVTNNAYNTHPL